MKYPITISNSDLISQGKDKAGISWGQAIVGSLVMMVVSAMSGFIPFGSLVLGAPLVLGYSIWALKIVREDDFKVDDDFKDLGFDDGSGGNKFYGKVKQVQYYDSALTDSELEQLTSWMSFLDMAQGQQYSIK